MQAWNSVIKSSMRHSSNYFLLKYSLIFSFLSCLLQCRSTNSPPFHSALQAGVGAADLAVGASSTRLSRIPGQTISFLRLPVHTSLATLPQPEKRTPIRATINKLRIMHNPSADYSAQKLWSYNTALLDPLLKVSNKKATDEGDELFIL